MGSVYKPKYRDKDGTMKESAVWWIKYYRNGKPYRESTKTTKITEAQRKLKQREGEIVHGRLPGIYFDRITFNELAGDLRENYFIEGRKSANRLELSLGHLKAFFDGKRVIDIDTGEIGRYIRKRLEEGAANATINRELSALKRMLNLGKEATPPKVATVPKIASLKEDNVRQGFFELSEFHAVRDALPKHLQGIMTIGFHFGCRLQEIVTLQWPQVDLKRGVFHLLVTKNDEARTIPMDAETRAVFEAQREHQRKMEIVLPWVFPNENGTGHVKRFDRAWKAACKKAGVPGLLFHDLRRTAVRNMIRCGNSESVAMKISGHKTRSVFDRYNIINDRDLKQAVERQERYLESQSAEADGQSLGKVTNLSEEKESRKTYKDTNLNSFSSTRL